MAVGIKTGIDLKSIEQTKNQFNQLIKDLKKISTDNPISFKVGDINNSFKQIKNNVSETSSSFKGFGSSVFSITGFFLKWHSATQLVTGAINSIKSGIGEIVSINKANTNIAMITGESVANVEKMNVGWMQMSKNLGVVMSETIAAQEEWLRAGESIESANKLVETNIKLARISQQSNQDTASQLIKIKEGWDLSVDGVISYSSKVALLDNQSSSSSEKINKAMTYSSQTFKDAGIEIDQALALVTNASENSARSGESLGRGWVSVLTNFTKMQEGVKNGNEEETDSINKAEMLMSKKGIALRKNADEFRNIGDVIKEIALNSKKFTEIEISDLAFKLAGKENMEMFKATINNYNHILELQDKLKEDVGAKTLNESYNKALPEIDAKINNLKNSATEMWQKLISSDLVKKGVDGLTSLVRMMSWLVNEGKAFTITMTGLTLVIANFGKLTSAINTVSTAFKYLKTFGLESLTLLNFNPVVLGLTAVAAIVGVVAYKHSQATQEMKTNIDALKNSYVSLEQSVKNLETVSSNDNRLKDMEGKVGKYVELNKKLEEINKNINSQNKNPDKSEKQSNLPQLIRERDELLNSLKKEKQLLDESNISVEKYHELKNNINAVNYANTIRDEAKAIWENRESVKNLKDEYNSLINAENKTENNKARLKQVTDELKNKVSGLTTTVDENGRMVITNNSLIDSQIQMYDKEGMTLEGLQAVMLENAKQHYELETGKTETSYREITKRISMIQAESRALLKEKQNTKVLADALKDTSTGEALQGKMDIIDLGLKDKKAEYDKLNEQQKLIDEIFKNSGINSPSDSSSKTGYTPTVTGDKKDSTPTPIKSSLDQYQKEKDLIAQLNSEIDKMRILLGIKYINSKVL